LFFPRPANAEVLDERIAPIACIDLQRVDVKAVLHEIGLTAGQYPAAGQLAERPRADLALGLEPEVAFRLAQPERQVTAQVDGLDPMESPGALEVEFVDVAHHRLLVEPHMPVTHGSLEERPDL